MLNATGRPGLARAGALALRRAGIDVVYFGNAAEGNEGGQATELDSTRILVRRGSLDAGKRVRAALKLGTVRVAPDSARLLDVSVLLGRDFRPPLELNP